MGSQREGGHEVVVPLSTRHYQTHKLVAQAEKPGPAPNRFLEKSSRFDSMDDMQRRSKSLLSVKGGSLSLTLLDLYCFRLITVRIPVYRMTPSIVYHYSSLGSSSCVQFEETDGSIHFQRQVVAR